MLQLHRLPLTMNIVPKNKDSRFYQACVEATTAVSLIKPLE